MKKWVIGGILAVIAVVIVACSGGGGSDPASQPANNTPSESLAGVDTNNDGVRDDVEQYINTTYANSAKTRNALRQSAKALQGAILDANDKRKSLQHAEETDRASDCIAYVRPNDYVQVAREMEARIANTDERLRAYLAYNKQLEGQMFPQAPFDQRKAGCEFNADSLPN